MGWENQVNTTEGRARTRTSAVAIGGMSKQRERVTLTEVWRGKNKSLKFLQTLTDLDFIW
jgi:hypothetical protein